jgi:ATP-dependent Lhr-like helicase
LVADLAGPGDLDAAEPSAAESSATGARAADPRAATERLLVQVQMLLERYGVVSREAVAAEGIAGGFGPLYKVLAQMEEAGRVRRGYFVEGLSGAQFALPGAVERLRGARLDEPPIDGFCSDDVALLAANDPANPYGALLPWPATAAPPAAGPPGAGAPRTAAAAGTGGPKRAAGAWVILVAGKAVLYLTASGKQLLSFPDSITDEGHELIPALALLPRVPAAGRKRRLIQHIDGIPALESPLREALLAAGFEVDHDALVPARFAPNAASKRGTGRDPNAIACAGPRP